MADSNNAGLSRYEGQYALGDFFSLRIWQENEELLVHLEGTPPGFVIKLVAEGQNIFRMENGPFPKGRLVFKVNSQGKIINAQLGRYELSPVSPEEVGTQQFNPLPSWELDSAKEQEFEATFQATRAGDGLIDYTLPYPKHEFVRYLQLRHQLLFHGSNNREISEFLPLRHSFELFDDSGRGNRPAVYATEAGVWSIFFAVIDRKKLSGTMTNGFIPFMSTDETVTDLYFFSLDEKDFVKYPWTNGMVYLLSPDTFERQIELDGTPTSEWTSITAVKPLARLPVGPEDFPFLNNVTIHYTSLISNYTAAMDAVFEVASSFEEVEDGVKLEFSWDNELYEQVCRLIPLKRKVMPTMRVELVFGAGSEKDKFWLRLSDDNSILVNMLKEKAKKYSARNASEVV